ncbi:cation efflux family-domain-containing protein [Paraphysoderma sedebokerense]|nr:cation efflux family-domain-containing protein [Paraphysoderma sedebokerense]
MAAPNPSTTTDTLAQQSPSNSHSENPQQQQPPTTTSCSERRLSITSIQFTHTPSQNPLLSDSELENETDPPTDSAVLSPSTLHLSHTAKCEQYQESDELEKSSAKKRLWIASGLCLVFFIVEVVGGVLSGSLAVLSDSFHMLSDLFGFAISLTAIYLSQRKATKYHSFGFHRAEILGALASVLFIWTITGILVYEAIHRVQNPEPINAVLMCVVSAIGLVVNLIMIFALGHSHGHGHGHSHGEKDEKDGATDAEKGKGAHAHKSQNINVRSAMLHVIGDTLSSVGVLTSSIVLIFKPEWVIVDPICTFVFSVLVIISTVNIIKDSLRVLMEATPHHIDPALVLQDLNSITLVRRVHDLHIWNLSIGKTSLAVHIEVPCDITIEEYDMVLRCAQNMVCGKYDIHHTTIQVEMGSVEGNRHCKSFVCCGTTTMIEAKMEERKVGSEE